MTLAESDRLILPFNVAVLDSVNAKVPFSYSPRSIGQVNVSENVTMVSSLIVSEKSKRGSARVPESYPYVLPSDHPMVAVAVAPSTSGSPEVIVAVFSVADPFAGEAA